MDSTTTPSITDQDTAAAALRKSRDDLAKAIDNADSWMKDFRDTIVTVRPQGILTVDEMAEAIGKDRNYVDTVWSDHGDAAKGKQTRVHVDAPEGAKVNAIQLLADSARKAYGTASTVGVLRAERDRVVALVYASKILGPSAIAREVGVDRNHVLRIARKAGIQPQHRTNIKNQHTAGK